MQPTKIVDLFAGPGGVDVAAEKMGVPTAGIEWDADACETRRAAGLGTIQGDVRQYGPADFPDADVLAGGRPVRLSPSLAVGRAVRPSMTFSGSLTA